MRLLVDGMNVIGSRPDGWWRDRDAAVRRLAGALAGLDGPVTVVFDGRPVDGLAEGEHAGVKVRYARHADDLIAQLAGQAVRVVTSDRELRDRASAAGAEVVGASWLLERLD